MSKIFLSHSSRDKEGYVRIVARQLEKRGIADSVILDEITFQEGRKTIEEIEDNLDVTDLFVVFISSASLDSEWVKKELFRAEQRWSSNSLRQICPIIIEQTVKYDDDRIPNWLKDNYNLQCIKRPTKATQIILQRMVELSFEKHPRLEERKNIFVGRNDLINVFEERIDDLEQKCPVCVVASGIEGIGRSTLLKYCLSKSNIRKKTYQYAVIYLNDTDSIEDFIIRLSDLGFTSVVDTKGLMRKTIIEKQSIAISIIKELQEANEIIFIIDNGCIVDYTGQVSEWFFNIIRNASIQDKITCCIVSKFRLVKYGEDVIYAEKQKFFCLEVSNLNKKERDGLLKRYVEFEGLDLEHDDMKLISGLLAGYPEQVFYSVTLIKKQGISYLRNHTDEIVAFNSKKANALLGNFVGDIEKIEFLSLLSSFDYIGMKTIFDIVGNDEKYKIYLGEFFLYSICEYVGTLKEYVRVNEVVKDYIKRNSYALNEKHKSRMKNILENFLINLNNNEYDMPEYLFYLKEALLEGMLNDDSILIPSLYLKTMNELYIQRKNKEVVAFAYKALEQESFMDPKMIFELRYLLCSALAKLRDYKFNNEVYKIRARKGHEADYYFLYAFYYRQIGRFEDALKSIEESTKIRPNFSKAKREKVQILIGLQQFSEAYELSKENYENYRDNPYHIQAYFTCLIKSEKNEDNMVVLNELIEALSAINTDVSKEMVLRCRAQIEAFYNGNREEALALINQAIALNPNIQYARLIKFDICEKFNMLLDMNSIIEFFEQPEYKNKYKNNIICFKSVVMAKEGQLEKAIDYFNKNIYGFTANAKENYVNKLYRIRRIDMASE